eukprot:363347-Chlamydomonas_euryale.AAC.4
MVWDSAQMGQADGANELVRLPSLSQGSPGAVGGCCWTATSASGLGRGTSSWIKRADSAMSSP